MPAPLYYGVPAPLHCGVPAPLHCGVLAPLHYGVPAPLYYGVPAPQVFFDGLLLTAFPAWSMLAAKDVLAPQPHNLIGEPAMPKPVELALLGAGNRG
ncbi:MAG TPA: hypothetical protein VMX14_02540, partial [Anaerolineae bacterium]|nr:hypothetical protein [Anaerolineae bacterium]